MTQELAYPTKPRRYLRYGWNSPYQHCYTDEEKKLLDSIISHFNNDDEVVLTEYFKLDEDKRLYGWWACYAPEHKINEDTYTLPNRPAKDLNYFPFWEYANNIAKKIANWQYDRSRNQRKESMNDPAMLIFEEVKYWFFNVLAHKNADQSTLELINRKQSYLRQLIHSIPQFGPDQFHLLQIDQQLEIARDLVSNNSSLKKLPELLSNLVLETKNLESTIANYLHFLLTNESVSPNFIYEEGNAGEDQHSPVWKLFKQKRPIQASQSINPFYLMKAENCDAKACFELVLDHTLLESLHFPEFISQETRHKYLESIALLSSLRTTRLVLEDYRKLQASLGTYVFAYHYRDVTKELAKNISALIDKSIQSLSKNIQANDEAFAVLLTKPQLHQQYHFFSKNKQALDTRLAKGTTTGHQLSQQAQNVHAGLNSYVDELQKLALSIEDGSAFEDLDASMHQVREKIALLNQFLPAQLDHEKFQIQPSKPIMTLGEGHLGIKAKDVGFDNGAWDKNYRLEPSTNKKIYCYRLFKDNKEVGFADFYDVPYLCRSKDSERHNIIRTGGILENLKIESSTIEDVCQAMPPTLAEKIFITTQKSAMLGTLRGTTNIFAMTLRDRNYSEQTATIISQASFYSAVFILNYMDYLRQTEFETESENLMLGAYQSAIKTGELFLSSIVFDYIGRAINQIGEYFYQNSWTSPDGYLNKAKSLLTFGVFAYNSRDNMIQSAAGFAAGTAAQYVTEKTGQYLLNKK